MPIATINGTRLFYDRAGDGEPLLLIPGLGATHQSFLGVIPALSARYQTISFDLRGVGESAQPLQKYSMELWADDVVALMDHLALDDAHIVGSSLGGCVAQVLAADHPDRVRSLVLAATFSELDPVLRLNYELRIALIEDTGMGDLFAALATASLFGRTFLASQGGTAFADLAMSALRTNDPAIYVEHLRALLRFGDPSGSARDRRPFTTRLPSITAPVLVLCGDEDVLTVPRFSRLLAQHLPNAFLHIQIGCGHANLLEQGEESATLILGFLAHVANHPVSGSPGGPGSSIDQPAPGGHR